MINTSVILAAGQGARLRNNKYPLPKPLVQLSGLLLIERVILTLAKAGCNKFIIIVGYESDLIISTLHSLESLATLSIEFTLSDDYQKGNGLSLRAGLSAVKDDCLVVMADHVLSEEMIRGFMKKALDNPQLPQLCCDYDLSSIFDLNDATKVSIHGGQIHEIGKKISTYDAVDTGLFYLPKQVYPCVCSAIDSGACSISEIVKKLCCEQPFIAVPHSSGYWQDVDDEAMLVIAERKLLGSLGKSSDGLISRYISRPISKRITRYLASTNITPNTVTTFVLLLSVLSAWVVSHGQYLYVFLGGLVFQVAATLDGCDGELSRLKFKQTLLGDWYDNISDYFRYGVFYFSVGIGMYRVAPSNFLLFFIYVNILMMIIPFLIIAAIASTQSDMVTHDAVMQLLLPKQGDTRSRFLSFVKLITKQDMLALISFVFCCLNLPSVIFWGTTVYSFLWCFYLCGLKIHNKSVWWYIKCFRRRLFERFSSASSK